MNVRPIDDWQVGGDAYEAYMGRWSRRMSERFVRWLDPEPGLGWLDVGCGTGALASRICDVAEPRVVVACDPSEPFLEYARRRIRDPRASIVLAGAEELPEHPGGFDRVVSGLVLNFLPDPARAVDAMRSRTRRGGLVAAFVWDYAGGMEFLRLFWDAAVALDPDARDLDEGARFPLCRPDALESVFRDARLHQVSSDALEIPTPFGSFADFWSPFQGGPGPAPAYVASLAPKKRDELRGRLERRIGTGGIHLVARAWAVRGTAL